ncbi:ADP-ribosylation factor-like protein 16 [Stomoxys calcitrans]|uniref:ADP-ribosylation factor-like protein 16 n=1 Tax=Stomoxys calcitrans TaxID=35570 RepID=A0A1I8Q851_STOCA|nr:ADP-ribosylation factor-like protein 16 [Stomoxys calcitrans]
MISCICLGPKRSGKTHLLKALQDNDLIDETSYSTPTIGTNIYNIVFPTNTHGEDAMKPKPPPPPPNEANTAEGVGQKKSKQLPPLKSIRILEIGGAMAPIWRQYFDDVKKLMYVVDTSNLCQISAAGVLFYSILAEPRLQKVRILLVLSKMDYAYRQMRNEALLMMQMSKLQKEIRQKVTIIEVSPVTKVGFDLIYNWLKIP